MKKIALASFGVLALVASTFAAPAGFFHSAPVKPTITARIPPASCPYNDPNGCGILD